MGGGQVLMMPGTLASAAGMLALVMTSSPAAVVVGAVLFGAGFGVTQNASLALMFARTSPSGYGTVSALWNSAYDAGLGLGAVGFGLISTYTGYPAAFALTAALILVALAPAHMDRKATYPMPTPSMIGACGVAEPEGGIP